MILRAMNLLCTTNTNLKRWSLGLLNAVMATMVFSLLVIITGLVPTVPTPAEAYWGITVVDLHTGSVGCALAECMRAAQIHTTAENGTLEPEDKFSYNNNFTVSDACRLDPLIGVVQGGGFYKSTFSIDIAFEYLRLRRSVFEVSPLQSRVASITSRKESLCTVHEGCLNYTYVKNAITEDCTIRESSAGARATSLTTKSCDDLVGRNEIEHCEPAVCVVAPTVLVNPWETDGRYAVVIDGSMVTSAAVLQLARDAFLTTNGTLADRLMAALYAGKSQGDGNTFCMDDHFINGEALEERYQTGETNKTFITSDVVSFKVKHAWNTDVLKAAVQAAPAQLTENLIQMMMSSNNNNERPADADITNINANTCEDLTYARVHIDGDEDAVDAVHAWYSGTAIEESQRGCSLLQEEWDKAIEAQGLDISELDQRLTSDQEGEGATTRFPNNFLRQYPSNYMLPPAVEYPTENAFKTEVVPTAVSLNYHFERDAFIDILVSTLVEFGKDMFIPGIEVFNETYRPDVSVHMLAAKTLVQLSYIGVVMQKTYFFSGRDADVLFLALKQTVSRQNYYFILQTRLTDVSHIARITHTGNESYDFSSVTPEGSVYRTDAQIRNFEIINEFAALPTGPGTDGGSDSSEINDSGGERLTDSDDDTPEEEPVLSAWVVLLLSVVAGTLLIGVVTAVCCVGHRSRQARADAEEDEEVRRLTEERSGKHLPHEHDENNPDPYPDPEAGHMGGNFDRANKGGGGGAGGGGQGGGNGLGTSAAAGDVAVMGSDKLDKKMRDLLISAYDSAVQQQKGKAMPPRVGPGVSRADEQLIRTIATQYANVVRRMNLWVDDTLLHLPFILTSRTNDTSDGAAASDGGGAAGGGGGGGGAGGSEVGTASAPSGRGQEKIQIPSATNRSSDPRTVDSNCDVNALSGGSAITGGKQPSTNAGNITSQHDHDREQISMKQQQQQQGGQVGVGGNGGRRGSHGGGGSGGGGSGHGGNQGGGSGSQHSSSKSRRRRNEKINNKNSKGTLLSGEGESSSHSNNTKNIMSNPLNDDQQQTEQQPHPHQHQHQHHSATASPSHQHQIGNTMPPTHDNAMMQKKPMVMTTSASATGAAPPGATPLPPPPQPQPQQPTAAPPAMIAGLTLANLAVNERQIANSSSNNQIYTAITAAGGPNNNNNNNLGGAGADRPLPPPSNNNTNNKDQHNVGSHNNIVNVDHQKIFNNKKSVAAPPLQHQHQHHENQHHSTNNATIIIAADDDNNDDDVAGSGISRREVSQVVAQGRSPPPPHQSQPQAQSSVTATSTMMTATSTAPQQRNSFSTNQQQQHLTLTASRSSKNNNNSRPPTSTSTGGGGGNAGGIAPVGAATAGGGGRGTGTQDSFSYFSSPVQGGGGPGGEGGRSTTGTYFSVLTGTGNSRPLPMEQRNQAPYVHHQPGVGVKTTTGASVSSSHQQGATTTTAAGATAGAESTTASAVVASASFPEPHLATTTQHSSHQQYHHLNQPGVLPSMQHAFPLPPSEQVMLSPSAMHRGGDNQQFFTPIVPITSLDQLTYTQQQHPVVGSPHQILHQHQHHQPSFANPPSSTHISQQQQQLLQQQQVFSPLSQQQQPTSNERQQQYQHQQQPQLSQQQQRGSSNSLSHSVILSAQGGGGINNNNIDQISAATGFHPTTAGVPLPSQQTNLFYNNNNQQQHTLPSPEQYHQHQLQAVAAPLPGGLAGLQQQQQQHQQEEHLQQKLSPPADDLVDFDKFSVAPQNNNPHHDDEQVDFRDQIMFEEEHQIIMPQPVPSTAGGESHRSGTNNNKGGLLGTIGSSSNGGSHHHHKGSGVVIIQEEAVALGRPQDEAGRGCLVIESLSGSQVHQQQNFVQQHNIVPSSGLTMNGEEVTLPFDEPQGEEEEDSSASSSSSSDDDDVEQQRQSHSARHRTAYNPLAMP